ncbi:hypothetical protein OZX68_03740 [Streptococcaceae bacterium ESL0729]|nr:hypothetical protein OZX68_03740 [Streptococcaceae bacterium ESL0729]
MEENIVIIWNPNGSGTEFKQVQEFDSLFTEYSRFIKFSYYDEDEDKRMEALFNLDNILGYSTD